MFTRKFWKQTAERMVTTAAQAVALALGADGLDWMTVGAGRLGAAAVGGLLVGLLACLIKLPIGEPDSPSAVRTD